MDHLEKEGHEIKVDDWHSHSSHNAKESFTLLDWADLIFCEWGLGNAVFYSKNKRRHQKLIIRVHRQELMTSYLNEVEMKAVDAIVTVSPYIYEEFSRYFKLPREKMKLIYNPVDLDAFKDQDNPDRKFNLGMVGYLPRLKRLDLALDIFERLYSSDRRYKLYLKGKRPEELEWLWNNEEERMYYEAQFDRILDANWGQNVIFESFGDVTSFYNKVEFILSISDVESFHLAAAEGMASGAYPIIMNWEGSDTIYPENFIIDDIEHVQAFVQNKRENEAELKKQLQKAVEIYSMKTVIEDLDSLLASMK